MMSVSTDCELVTAYTARGSENAFHALVTRHVNLVYATALRHVGDTALAEEITQNVFIALARNAPRLAGIQTLAGWLHRSAILEAKARVRAELRRGRREEMAAEAAALQREGTSPLDALVPLLDEGLLNLRDGDRLALVLRFLEERSRRGVGCGRRRGPQTGFPRARPACGLLPPARLRGSGGHGRRRVAGQQRHVSSRWTGGLRHERR